MSGTNAPVIARTVAAATRSATPSAIDVAVAVGLRAREHRKEDLRDRKEELVRQEREKLACAVVRDPFVRSGFAEARRRRAFRQEPSEKRDVRLHEEVREELRRGQRQE